MEVKAVNSFYTVDVKGFLWIGGDTESDKLAQWLWDLTVQLKIYRPDSSQSPSDCVDTPDIDGDIKYISVATAKQKEFGIGVYFHLLTKCGAR